MLLRLHSHRLLLVALLLLGLVTVVVATVEAHMRAEQLPKPVAGFKPTARRVRQITTPIIEDEPLPSVGLIAANAVQDERLYEHDRKFEAIDKFVEATNVRVGLVESQSSMQKGIVIGFGGLLGFLGTLTVILQLRGPKKG